MLTTKSRRLRLQEDEEDSLLAGVDFHTHYLGSEEMLVKADDIDGVVGDIYSRYLTNDELNSSVVLAITVDAHQLVFFNTTNNETEFLIPLSDIKSIHSGSKWNKFPNAVILVACLPTVNARAHVFHCTNQRKAKELYNAINRAFEYHVPEKSLTNDQEEPTSKAKHGRVYPSNGKNKTDAKLQDRKLEFEPPSDHNTSPTELNDKSLVQAKLKGDLTGGQTSPDLAKTLFKGRSKSCTQTKSTEGLGLLENIDPEEGFDDEFTNLARSRSLSETIKCRFGR